MITWMTVFMGFMFYSVPAGLCVYFIASSLWGLAERKLLDRTTTATAGTSGTTVIETTAEPAPRAERSAKSGPPDREAAPPTGAGGLWARLLNAADAAAADSRPGATRKSPGPDRNDTKGSKPRR
jgi:YidC/Oxa1 family membrane protein insertase